ncbi:cytochrome-c peroxidase [Candidatus Colwellia aromaticivorans]|uniref:cytochrome-c peroxidase n=1 Tax=Candidatus Colwellia aromaticivorans TaxID=2267621 RepID=UPI000DF29007|nr:cytochrome c peroxidase [Candidatus Colwellia aromaticivorans]
MAKHSIKPLSDKDFYFNGQQSAAKVELGRQLFFDKILSGNQNISCATCHHPMAATGDGVSLPIGEGGRGLGPTRRQGMGASAATERVPRNAPHIFNLGSKSFDKMFHDGRVAIDLDSPSGFLSPAAGDLPDGLDNVLAVQAMFPVTSGAEMAGQAGENNQADLASMSDLLGIWQFIANKLQAIPEYVSLFEAAYNDINSAGDITYVHAANAIAAFEAVSWRFDNSPFDRYLRGDKKALSHNQKKGMKLFYGKAGCGSCHSGALQSDQEFHAIAMPQLGPGKGDGVSGHDDIGRQRVSNDANDKYQFRTPSLRNVAITAPYGHDGAYNTLQGVVEHHLSPIDSLQAYDTSQAFLPFITDADLSDFLVHNDLLSRQDLADANELAPTKLSARQINELMDFLYSLTDPAALDMRMDIPKRSPSGLAVFD